MNSHQLQSLCVSKQLNMQQVPNNCPLEFKQALWNAGECMNQTSAGIASRVYLMEVSLHELKDYIDVFELPRTGR